MRQELPQFFCIKTGVFTHRKKNFEQLLQTSITSTGEFDKKLNPEILYSHFTHNVRAECFKISKLLFPFFIKTNISSQLDTQDGIPEDVLHSLKYFFLSI